MGPPQEVQSSLVKKRTGLLPEPPTFPNCLSVALLSLPDPPLFKEVHGKRVGTGFLPTWNCRVTVEGGGGAEVSDGGMQATWMGNPPALVFWGFETDLKLRGGQPLCSCSEFEDVRDSRDAWGG